MKQVRSDEARRTFRDLLDEVEHQGEHVEILRYTKPAAVIVPVEWYGQAKALEAIVVEAIESGGFSIGKMEILKERYQAQADALRQGRRQARLGHRDPRAVHHIDGDPYNNDPANLRVIDAGDAGTASGTEEGR